MQALNEYTHHSIDAFALECARRALLPDAPDMEEIRSDIVKMHEALQPIVGEMYTEYGRYYEECIELGEIEKAFCSLETYLHGIITCLADDELQEYLDEKIFPFCR